MNNLVLHVLTGLADDDRSLRASVLLVVPAQHPDLVEVFQILDPYWHFVCGYDLNGVRSVADLDDDDTVQLRLCDVEELVAHVDCLAPRTGLARLA